MKFIVDTNVLSELMSRRPNPRVVDWVRQHDEDLTVSWVTIAELRKGVALRQDAGRRAQLGQLVDRIVAGYFGEDAPHFTDATALAFAELVAARMPTGRPMGWPDTVIAAQAKELGLAVVTRNTRHFHDVPTINPWEAPTASGELGGRDA